MSVYSTILTVGMLCLTGEKNIKAEQAIIAERKAKA